MPEPRTVYVIDDDEAMRESLSILLGSRGLVAQTFASAPEFLAVASSVPSGCVLTDLRMPAMDGFELLQGLRERSLGLPVIVMTGHGDVPLAVQAIKAGAVDFIEKPFPGDALIEAVRSALRAAGKLPAIEDLRGNNPAFREIVERLASLTPRERQVMQELAAGKQNKEIAHQLGTSPRTVEIQRARVMEKMHARNLSALVRMAVAAELDRSTATQ